MTTSTASSDAPSEGTVECRTGAIMLREGARAVGSTFAREWDSQPEPASVAALPPETPTSLRALPALPSPSAPPLSLPPALPPLAAARPAQRPGHRRASSSRRARARPVAVPWSFAGAFALGAAIAALAGVGIERGAIEVAALASAIAGGMTLSAALGRVASKGRADGRHS
ncbi:MAG TPA: hypothetical protein VLT33_51735 [Labilithrix sp.]|nr:hypothetical protein [Labilithrix sp.]